MTSTVIGGDYPASIGLAGGEFAIILAAGLVRFTGDAITVNGTGAAITNLGTIFAQGPDSEAIWLAAGPPPR